MKSFDIGNIDNHDNHYRYTGQTFPLSKFDETREALFKERT